MIDCTTKACTKCKREFPATAEYFYRSRTGRLGLRSQCKSCSDEYSRLREKRPEVKARKSYYMKEYRKRPSAKESARRSKRKYLLKPDVRARASERNRRPEIMAMNRVSAQKSSRRPGARERKREYMREYFRRPDVVERRNISKNNRRARKMNAGGSYTADDIMKQYSSQNGRCWWCGKKVGKKYHIDHVIPLSRGGSNGPRNIVISCPHCNVSKNDKLPQEWVGRLF